VPAMAADTTTAPKHSDPSVAVVVDQFRVSDGIANGSLPSGEIEPSVTLALVPSESSSGGGLGIHQPGSITCGFAIVRQPASGTARDRAKCPAVARFTSVDRSAA
jgi:hypothetical protein